MNISDFPQELLELTCVNNMPHIKFITHFSCNIIDELKCTNYEINLFDINNTKLIIFYANIKKQHSNKYYKQRCKHAIYTNNLNYFKYIHSLIRINIRDSDYDNEIHINTYSTFVNKYKYKHILNININANYLVCNNKLRCMAYYNKNINKCNSSFCTMAARNGNLKSLKYLYKHKFPWNYDTQRIALFYGYLNCMKYAHKHGCPWDENTCSHAIFFNDIKYNDLHDYSNNNLNCLKYAYIHGCPCSQNIIDKHKLWQFEKLK